MSVSDYISLLYDHYGQLVDSTFLNMVNMVTSVSVVISNAREKCDIYKAGILQDRVKTEKNQWKLLPNYLTSL
jgi:hypothetical protein